MRGGVMRGCVGIQDHVIQLRLQRRETARYRQIRPNQDTGRLE